MKGILMIFAISSFSAALGSDAKLIYEKYLTCTGKDISVTIYKKELSDNKGLIVLEVAGESPQYSTTKSSLNSHGYRFHSNFFKMNFDFYEEGAVRTIFEYKSVRHDVTCDVKY